MGTAYQRLSKSQDEFQKKVKLYYFVFAKIDPIYDNQKINHFH